MKKNLLFKMLAVLVVLITCIPQVWATYYYRGEKNSWGATAMTNVNGIYSYYSATSGAHQFKISTSTSSYDYNYTYVTKNYKQTDVSNIGDYSSNNCYCWQSSAHYILVFNPNTSVNSTNKPIICAATALPSAGFESDGNTMSYYNNVDGDVKSSDLDRTNGSTIDLTSKAITDLYLKAFNTKMYQHYEVNLLDKTAYHFYYKIHRTAEAAGSTGFTEITSADGYSAGTLTWGNFDGSKYRKPTYYVTANQSLLSGLGSGLYTMSYYFTHVGTTETYRLPSTSSKYNELKWKIPVPAMATHTVTSDGTGDGSSGTPFSVAVGGNLTITVSGTQASSDANSSLYVSFDGGSTYSATNTYTINSITSSKLHLSIKAKYYNSADDLSGTVYNFGDVYYQGTLTPSLAISSFTQNASTVTAANSGSSVTINASRQNAGSATITYAYSTDNSNWTTIASTTSTSQSWTLPAVTSTTTYYVKASMTYDATGYSDTETFTVYGKKTIKVKDTNNWGDNFKIHRWGGVAEGTTWPGETTNITSAGGQWKQVVLYSSSTDFLFDNSSDPDHNKTANKTFAGMTDGGCYVIANGTGGSLALTSTNNCPTAPSVTTAAATSVGTTSVQFNASSVSANNDAITDYGFKWGTTDACSSGTITASNLSSTTFSVSKGNLTNGTTYYFKAYATNGQGTTYGDPVSVRTKFITTVTLDQEGGADGTTSVTATEGSAMPSGKTAPGKTGYTFGGYYTNAGGSGTQYYNSSMGSAHNWDVAASTATIHAKWTANTYSVSFGRNGGAGGDDMSNQGFTYDVAQNLTKNKYTRTGYNFDGWATSESGAKVYNDQQSVSNLSSAQGATFPLYAHWVAKKCTVLLDQTGAASSGSVISVANVTYGSAMPSIAGAGNLPTAPVGSAFMGYYDQITPTLGTQYYDATGASVTNWNIDTESNTTLYAYFKQAEITALSVSGGGQAESGETVTVTPTITPSPAGTTIVCWQLLQSDGSTLVSPQPAFSPAAGNIYNSGGTNAVTFPAPNASGNYKIKATLRTGNDCGAGTALDDEVATLTVAGTHTVTIQYKCGDVTIATSTSATGKPFDWTEITAPNIVGYAFSKWKQGDGITIQGADGNGEKATATINFEAIYEGTLTVYYTRKKMIYFKNTLNWSGVTVYFYKNNSYWSNTQGTGANPDYQFTNKPYSDQYHGDMTNIAGTDIWYYEVGNISYTSVNFTELNQNGYGFFDETNGVENKVAHPCDNSEYYNQNMAMYVPIDEVSRLSNAKSSYYFRGYWINYPENTGYTLKIYNAYDADKASGAAQSIMFPYSSDKELPINMDVEFNNSGKFWFLIYRNDGTYWGAENASINQNQHEEFRIYQSDHKPELITSAPGKYNFRLSYFDDGTGGYMYHINVDFPAAEGDYRVVYKDNAEWSQGTAHNASWYHPSDVIRKNNGSEPKKDTVSFFVSKGTGITPSMKFQYISSIDAGTGAVTWQDVTNGAITIPTAVLNAGGVYNFIITQPAGGESISLEKAEAYTGDFYIRTDVAGNTKWDSYKSPDHMMTYSDYAETNENFTHYYAHWVERYTNVKFCIANDYSPCISDTLIKDVGTTFNNMDNDGRLYSQYPSVQDPTYDKYSANIRFMYNKNTNKISRAYVSGSSNEGKFIIMQGNSTGGKIYDANGNDLAKSGLPINAINLTDDQNFIYETTIKANPSALVKLYANYCDVDQYFKGAYADGAFTKDVSAIEILGGTLTDASTQKESMRIVYDFKTNRLVCAWLPSGQISGELEINADVMLIREHQEAAQQITFANGNAKLSEVKTVYGVMRFNRWILDNKSTSDGHATLPVGSQLSSYQRGLYFISFPFNVKLSDVFGLGTYGVHWIIEEYDGAERAAKGYWKDSPGFWKYVTNRDTKVLEANKGYLLALDLDRMKSDNTSFWTNNIEQVELFFPSASTISNIKQTDVNVSVPEHTCNIGPRFVGGDDRRVKDSHWNVIGVPSYANYGSELTDGTSTISWNDDPETDDLPFLYEWQMNDNSLAVQSGTTYAFKAMHSYVAQYSGTLHWSLASATPAASGIAARHRSNLKSNYEFRLELNQNGQEVDRTFISMRDNDAVTTAFDFNYDLSKEMNANKSNIYTMVTSIIDGEQSVTETAGNCLPLETEQVTTVPVGVVAKTSGEYTFAMPDGTEGVSVTLIDGETGRHIDMAIEDYTVELTAGTYDGRFYLQIDPRNAATTIDIVGGEGEDVKAAKIFREGLLYIQRGEKLYDARGARVE